MSNTEKGSLLKSNKLDTYGATSDTQLLPKKQFYDNEDGTWSSIACYLTSMSTTGTLKVYANGAQTILIPFYLSEVLHQNKSVIGIVLFLVYLCDVLLIGPAGLFTSKYGSIMSFIVWTLMTSIGYGLWLLSVWFNFYQLQSVFVCAVILGSSEAFYLLGFMTFSAKYIYTNKRGRFNTYVAALRRLGYLLGTFATGYIIQYASVEIALIIVTGACIGSIFCILFLLTPPKITQQGFDGSVSSLKKTYSQKNITYQRLSFKIWISPKQKNPNQSNSPDNSIKMINVIKKHWLILFNVSVYSFGLTYMRYCRKIIMTFQALNIGLTASEIGFINAMSYVPDVAFFYFAGCIMDRYGRLYTMVPTIILFMGANFIVAWMTTYKLLLFDSLFFGLANGFSTGLVATIAGDIAPKYCRAKFLAAFNILSISGNVASPLVTGYLSHRYHSTKVAGIVGAGVGLISLIWALFIIPEPKNQQKTYEKLEQMEIENDNNNNDNDDHDNTTTQV